MEGETDIFSEWLYRELFKPEFVDGFGYLLRVDNPNGMHAMGDSGIISRKVSWTKGWSHTGADAFRYISRQPYDTVWVRCPEEVEYQNRAVDLCRIISKLTEPWETFDERPSILPRPFSYWYMFQNRETCIENSAFETRIGRAGMKAAGNAELGTVPSNRIPLLFGWHDVGSFGMSVKERG